MQLLFIFILISCALMVLGLIYITFLLRSIHKLKKAKVQRQTQASTKQIFTLSSRLYLVEGLVLALATFTGGMFLNLGEAIIYIPLLPLGLGCAGAMYMHTKGKKVPEPTQHPVEKLWGQHATEVQFVEKSSYAEKNSLEMQAFGNDMYMTQSMRIQGNYEGTRFAQYSLCLPDYFSGRGMELELSTAFPASLFIISKNFPCSQLLTYAGLWKSVSSNHEAFDTSYSIFSKEPEKVVDILTEKRIKALLSFAQVSGAAQSYHFDTHKEENTGIVRILLTEEDGGLSLEQEITRLTQLIKNL